MAQRRVFTEAERSMNDRDAGPKGGPGGEIEDAGPKGGPGGSEETETTEEA